MCNFGQSAMSSIDIKGRKAAKEEKIATVQFWCKILQVIVSIFSDQFENIKQCVRSFGIQNNCECFVEDIGIVPSY